MLLLCCNTFCGAILHEGMKAASIRVFKARAIVLDYIGVDSILLDPAFSEIFYFKHHIGASLITISSCNPNVLNIGDVLLVLLQAAPQLD